MYRACARCSGVERKRIKEALNRLDAKLLPSRRSYDYGTDWLPNAERQQFDEATRFWGIIATANPRGTTDILVVDDLNEGCPKWQVRRSCRVP